MLWAVTANYRGWHTGFAPTLWVTVAATMLLYAVLAGTARHAWRLGPILIPYLLLTLAYPGVRFVTDVLTA